MSATFADLNGWGAMGVAWAAAAAVQTSVLIVVVLILSWVLRRRVNPVVLQGLWMLVLVKLLLPPSFSLPTGVGYWLPRQGADTNRFETTVSDGNEGRVITSSLSEAFTGADFPGGAKPDSAVGWALLDWKGGMALLGSLGSLVVLAGVLRAWIRLRQQIRKAEVANESWQAAARDCASRLGLRRIPEVRMTSWLGSPAVCGLKRGVILIPAGLAADLGPEARKDVLLHEMAHMRRGDLWLGTLEVFVLVTYWWHPLVWLARSRWQALREEIADAVVIAEGQRDAGAYAETLLSVAKAAVHRPVLALGLMGIFESRGALRQRVEAILNEGGRRAPRLGWKAGLALILFGFLVLPMGEGGRRSLAAEFPESEIQVEGSRDQPGASIRYQFDPEFVRYFGHRGVDEVEAAMRILETNHQRTDFYTVERRAFTRYHVGLAGPPKTETWPFERTKQDPLGSRSGLIEPTGIVTRSTVTLKPVGLSSDTAPEPGAQVGGGVLHAGGTLIPTNFVVQVFRVNVTAMMSGLRAARGTPLDISVGAYTAALKDTFAGAGLTFEPPRSLHFDVQSGQVLVVSEPLISEKAAQVIEALTEVPAQVLIEARLVKVDDSRLEFLRALARPDAPMLGSETFRGIWEMIEALVPANDRGPRPRVVTLSGRPAMIEDGKVEGAKEGVDEEKNSGVARDWFGSRFEVDPRVEKDGTNIVTQLRVSQREAIGESRGATAEGRVVEREVVAAPRMRSGETVVLKLEDQPGSAKANDRDTAASTYVLVTVTIIDPAGNPVSVAKER